MSAPLLTIEGLRTTFRTGHGLVRAVDGVDLTVSAGESLGVVGESGSGKSVTFASVMGLVKPPGVVTADRLAFDGVDLLGLAPAARRALRGRDIAMTMQDALTALNPALSVATQIVEVLKAHGTATTTRGARARALELMRHVGIPAAEKRLDDYPHQFSGGMRQRIMIAIALACRPKLLIADEPTTALDVTIQAQVLDLIAELRRELGMALVLITHDLGVVAEHCDRVAVMYAGQIVETGPTAAVIARPRHPYTQGLIDSVPRLDDPGRRIRPIPGGVPDLARVDATCRFAGRCRHRAAACDATIAMQPVGEGRAARCVRLAAIEEGWA
jgi:oligopeptide/dipeptide ABC transporter ATP-binding protein